MNDKSKQATREESKSDKKRLDTKTKLRIAVRELNELAEAAKRKQPKRVLERAIAVGMKVAEDSVFYNPESSILLLAKALRSLGADALTKKPETLFALIDQKFKGWSQKKAADAILSFHDKGEILTDVPALTRNKIYGIRLVYTSDSAHTEWSIFEKVGSAFNDRLARFNEVEPLSAGECAKTIALIENLRPDKYTDEIKIYLGACCHRDGLYTVLPVKWLAIAEEQLQRFNFESSGTHFDPELRKSIAKRFEELKKSSSVLRQISDDIVDVQASKLLAIDHMAEDAVSG